jgi:FKBP-type peptidyl-prolyl cis-trans isomerase
MRPSNKSRSRNKGGNRRQPNNNTNIVNRVFDSAGPEGKVRGTPQQIVEKYSQLARDAQLSGDRVAAESFMQHAEHYSRMLAVAQKEQAARQAEHAARQAEQAERQAEQQRQRNEQRAKQQEQAEAKNEQPEVAETQLVDTPENTAPKPKPKRSSRVSRPRTRKPAVAPDPSPSPVAE